MDSAMQTRTGNGVEWRCEEPGYWTSELGGIVRERSGWWWYPDEDQEDGPFATLASAMDAAARRSGR